MSSFSNASFKLRNVDVITLDRYIFLLNVLHPLYSVMTLTTTSPERKRKVFTITDKTNRIFSLSSIREVLVRVEERYGDREGQQVSCVFNC